ncbi:MAG: RidA family protein [Coriobacteriia bacterium]|nr:RidA family protein [Coriobacteriia bacterium]MBN2822035.1 RidA family protein [Coriobacteriia bacterium]
MAADVARTLAEAGLLLPGAPGALGAYLPAVRTGELVFTAGQLPMLGGGLIATGTVGVDVEPEVAKRCAEQCALNALAAASTVCDLSEVLGVVKLTGFVASAQGFGGQPSVIDGASAVMAIAFGDSGRHAREAVGVAALPLNAPVEVSLILRLRG